MTKTCKKIIAAVICSTSFFSNSFSQELLPSINGGFIGGMRTDVGKAAAADGGGFIGIGTTSSFDLGVKTDIYVVKYAGSGNRSFRKLVGTEGVESGYDVLKTNDGNYLLVGTTSVAQGFYTYIYVIKMDKDGNIIWSNKYGGDGSTAPSGGAIETNDGGYLIAGYSSSFGEGGGLYILKINQDGIVQWSRILGDNFGNAVNAITKSSDGGYFLAGSFYKSSYGDLIVVKIDASGNMLWERTIGDEKNNMGEAVIATADGGCIVAGSTSLFLSGGQDDISVIRFNNTGALLWQKTILAAGYNNCTGAAKAPNGDIVLAGMQNDTRQLYLRMSVSGSMIWAYQSSDPNSDNEARNIISIGSGDNYLASGAYDSNPSGGYNSDMLFTAIAGDGNFCRSQPLSTTLVDAGFSAGTSGLSLTSVITNQSAVVTHVNDPGTEERAGRICNSTNPAVTIQEKLMSLKAGAINNPVNNTLAFPIETEKATHAVFAVSDLNSNLMLSYKQMLPKGQQHISLDVSKLRPGIYILSITAGQQVITQKILKQ